MRTIPGMERNLERLDEILERKFIPALFGNNISPEKRELLSLPIRSGGLGISNLSEKAAMEYEASKAITAPLASIIVMQYNNMPSDNEVKTLKNKMMTTKNNFISEKTKKIENKLTEREI